MDPIVKNIVDQLKPYKPERIILFGSYAYGRPSKNSDIDLLVIKRTPDSFHDRQVKARMLLRTTNAIDIFVFTPEEFEKAKRNNPFIKEVDQTGKVVYG